MMLVNSCREPSAAIQMQHTLQLDETDSLRVKHTHKERRSSTGVDVAPVMLRRRHVAHTHHYKQCNVEKHSAASDFHPLAPSWYSRCGWQWLTIATFALVVGVLCDFTQYDASVFSEDGLEVFVYRRQWVGGDGAVQHRLPVHFVARLLFRKFRAAGIVETGVPLRHVRLRLLRSRYRSARTINSGDTSSSLVMNWLRLAVAIRRTGVVFSFI